MLAKELISAERSTSKTSIFQRWFRHLHSMMTKRAKLRQIKVICIPHSAPLIRKLSIK